jgi:[protein-PII] uridylyltransferase
MARSSPLVDEVVVDGGSFPRAYSDLVDTWLVELYQTGIGDRSGVALVAIGGYGRRELSAQSDLDVLLLHDSRDDVAKLAEAVWYPVWDRGLKLGHVVFTVRQAVAAAGRELERATALADARHLAGDPAATADLRDRVLRMWERRRAPLLAELAQSVHGRHQSYGDVAFELEPDLKEGRGGLRDVHALRWAELAQPGFSGGAVGEVEDDYQALLTARVALHRRTGRPGDRLVLEEQDGVAELLGDPDADALMARLAAAARRIGWHADEAWEGWRRRDRQPRRGWPRRIMAPGVEVRDEVVELEPELAADPLAVLRVAVAAAKAGKRISRSTLDRLATRTPPLGDPWPDEARDLFAALLRAGSPTIGVIEALDHHGLMDRLIPEWAAVRSKPQRNALHRFTVDRHLCETAANAVDLAGRVRRPDLLVVGALLHDIGKGYPGDHTVVGMQVITDMALRMGYPPADIETLVELCRHHLLLGDVATRRDLSDPGTIRSVADAVGTVERLKLLAALTEADGLATGPAAWGPWKAGLVADLVERTTRVLAGERASDAGSGFPSEDLRSLMVEGRRRLWGQGEIFTVIAPDRPGVFSSVAGALALAGLEVLGGAAYSDDAMAACQFVVERPAHEPVDWSSVERLADRALAGRVALAARLARRAEVYAGHRRPRSARPPITDVRVDNDLSDVATVIEVHAPDEVGLLYRVTRALAELGLDIRSAKLQTFGDQAVDSFYLRGPDGAKVTDPELLAELRLALGHALGPEERL